MKRVALFFLLDLLAGVADVIIQRGYLEKTDTVSADNSKQ